MKKVCDECGLDYIGKSLSKDFVGSNPTPPIVWRRVPEWPKGAIPRGMLSDQSLVVTVSNTVEVNASWVYIESIIQSVTQLITSHLVLGLEVNKQCCMYPWTDDFLRPYSPKKGAG